MPASPDAKARGTTARERPAFTGPFAKAARFVDPLLDSGAARVTTDERDHGIRERTVVRWVLAVTVESLPAELRGRTLVVSRGFLSASFGGDGDHSFEVVSSRPQNRGVAGRLHRIIPVGIVLQIDAGDLVDDPHLWNPQALSQHQNAMPSM